MKKLLLITALILIAFISLSKAASHKLPAPNLVTDTIKPMTKAKTDAITPKAKTDTIAPVMVKHDTVAMSTKQLNHIVKLMRMKKNDVQKIKVMKTGLKLVKGKGLKLDQLKTLLNQFLNDASKLSMAEYAYPRTVDWPSFGDLDNLFAAQESKDKLDEFLKHNK